jgi:hypothetical protein
VTPQTFYLRISLTALASQVRIATVVLGPLLFTVPMALKASELRLKPETLTAWDQYVREANSRMQARLQPGGKFLWIDEQPGRAGRVRSGEILAAPIDHRNPQAVPSGLIHDWIAATFIPSVTLGGVQSVIRDYGRYSDYYKPNVIEAKPLKLSDDGDRFSMTFLNKSLFEDTALVSEYQSTSVNLGSGRFYSLSRTTRVQEIDDYGRASQREMSPDTGSGFIWRLFSISRLEERDGGVYIELEIIALSRDIPSSYRWFVEPIVRRVSKDAMITSLQQTSEAIRTSVQESRRTRSLPRPATALHSYVSHQNPLTNR